MTIRDLLNELPDMQFEADICVIGGGRAGISIALQFAQTRTKVIIVESGGLSVDPETEALNEIESVGLRRAPQNVTRCRGLGGTSALWSGRCGAFDPFDFQKRPWIPDSGWPMCYDDVAPFVDRAGQMLGLGPSLYGRTDMGALPINRGDAPWNSGQLLPVIFQASLHGEGTLKGSGASSLTGLRVRNSSVCCNMPVFRCQCGLAILIARRCSHRPISMSCFMPTQRRSRPTNAETWRNPSALRRCPEDHIR